MEGPLSLEAIARFPTQDEAIEIVTPYNTRQVYHILTAWCEADCGLGRSSTLGTNMPLDFSSQDFRLTISSAVDGIHRGLQVWFPCLPWGKVSWARRWLKAWSDANAAIVADRQANERAGEKFNAWMRTVRKPPSDIVRNRERKRCWQVADEAGRAADRANEALRELERSECMRLTVSWLGIAFALAGCSDHLVKQYAEEAAA